MIHSSIKNMVLIFTIIFPTITFAQWSVPVDISPNAINAILNESMGSCIGTVGDTVHVVWADRINSTKGAIYYKHSTDTGLTWHTPIAITDTSGNAWHPAIAVNGLNIHVAWMEIDPTNNANRTNYYTHSVDGGNTWLPRTLIDTAVGDWPGITLSGNIIYVVNDWHVTPTNSEIFFLKSMDNGTTWSTNQQLTFSDGRSEDEAIQAYGSHIHMTWNDNRNGAMQLYYKESSDYGVTWGPDVLLIPQIVYGPAICVDGDNVDVVCSQSPNGQHPQIHFKQSLDAGGTWGTDINLTNDTLHTYIYPTIIRCGSDIHATYVEAGVGGQYLHSGNSGLTWDIPFTFFSGNAGITVFSAYSGCTLHIIYIDNANHHIYYTRNPIGNAGHCSSAVGIAKNQLYDNITVYPNPFCFSTTLQTGKIFKDATLTIYNSIGQQVKQIKNISGQTVNLYRDNLPSGLYIIRLTQDNKTIATDKLVITDK